MMNGSSSVPLLRACVIQPTFFGAIKFTVGYGTTLEPTANFMAPGRSVGLSIEDDLDVSTVIGNAITIMHRHD